ncbi:MAG: hypothetical protein K2M85_00220 [Paramuribaculum sp.]|nr:hypothetical protein [Bacteroides sp.]MDE7459490.1 hypothetical protein [Paramuribaculum sp.]
MDENPDKIPYAGYTPTPAYIRRMMISITACWLLGFIAYRTLHWVTPLFAGPAVGWALPLIISTARNRLAYSRDKKSRLQTPLKS